VSDHKRIKLMTFAIRNFAATLLVAGLCSGAAMAQSEPRIAVTGEGVVTVTPDMARITLGVVQEAPTAAEALAAMSAAMENELVQLAAAQIEPKHIQTSNLRLDQRYSDYVDGQPRQVTGYIASTDMQVQVFDLDNLGRVLDAAVRDGANQMNGLQFDVADRAPAMTAARQAAVADAKAKAEVYTQAAGVSLGPIMIISESGNTSGPMPMMAEMAFDAGSRSVPVAAGEMSISASISRVWGLE
jgi:uncharacterized protein YggE